MGCQSEVNIDDYFTFSVCCHDPDTGVLTDADAAPSYLIYEDETAVAILSGSMAILDTVNTTGFYTERIQATAANGFEDGKSYTIYIEATVDGDTGGISYALRCKAPVEDLVWDEPLTSASHDVGYSAGQRLRYLILTGDSAQAGSSNSITLAATESATDHIFNENIISIVAGTGAGQTRLIAEYDGSTKVAIVDKAWFVNPTAGSVYEILPFSSILVADHGIATAGTASSITLASTASANDDDYIGSVIYISSGTGAKQVRLITDYDGTSKIATISDDWTTTPAAGSVYKILPVGRTIVDSLSADAGDAIAADVWSYSTRRLTQSAAAVTATLAGDTITIKRGDTFSVSLTGLGDISASTKLWFSVKNHLRDADSVSIVQIDDATGLLYINGAASANAANGSITVDDAVAGNITIVLDEAETDDLVPVNGLVYDVQMLDSSGDVTTLTEGDLDVEGDVTRVIV